MPRGLINPADVAAQAREELREERRRELIDAEKRRLKGRRWWHRFIPFQLSITVKRRTP
jgi:hypothetical protein